MAPSDFSSAVDALERHAAKLSHAVDNLEGWLLCATIIVVIGLVIEALEAAEYVHEQKSRRARGMGIEWTKGAILIGAFLVLVGVFGEGAIQFVASKDEAQRYIDEQNIDRLRTAEAIDAEGRIATLQKRTADAQRDAALANERAKSLEAKAAASAERAAKLEIQAAQAEKDAADAKAAEDNLRGKVVWRQLTDEQCSTIVNSIGSNFGLISIEYTFGDPEALLLAIQFENCFGTVAHWQVGFAAISLKEAIPIGLVVAGSASAAHDAAIQGLDAAQIKYVPDNGQINEHIVSRFGARNFVGAVDLKLIVGSRPVF